MAALSFKTLDALQPKGRKVLLRADLNVPVRDGKITDLTRIERLAPTIRELADKGARVIVVSHFDRPKGQRVPEMSLAPIAAALGTTLGRPVQFADDCIGPVAEEAVSKLQDGDVLVLENTRFHAGEEKNDPDLSKALAALADDYVNDAFSAAHRAHASTEGVARFLPSFAGRLMEAELNALNVALENPVRPVGAIVGGAKISTKLDLIGNLLDKVDVLIIGGAMANTFLAANGVRVGKSLQEADMHDTARAIMAKAEERGCEIVLPVDAVTATEFRADPPTRTVPIDEIPADAMMLDAGPETVTLLIQKIVGLKTLVWNGPLGAFELHPFDTATNLVAAEVARRTQAGQLTSVAGGGDTVSALRHAGVADEMSYTSTAGGAFLEWLEGKVLPGIQALGEVSGRILPL
ncbi:Phosphoglycerate kinase [Gluconacetobacter diazotrophicus PA1 5]|uniref:Phosphoglycerate kinase n=2 Tax=Gluconacetobacter diazotrophicus TaxID=33996 RepID=A9HM30_GLUDA|nr:phosphoglycerate kinase [Gluconacetobacter diazotrophicus]ACI50314.1 Phosphoglycerate kinase [Gluconacetobacter diazotrophicus PA1 5]MBB2154740.1 phosphoglycerate kinase [Gluconacetobacter diazotrophicus]TWB08363.1 phosphoglycerate kinase [Gluconacetobacter diazotrophicus]CAP56246.1 Phosphoglycerate kinase [Gluconacetobacter diazotrophicus PA1 5]